MKRLETVFVDRHVSNKAKMPRISTVVGGPTAHRTQPGGEGEAGAAVRLWDHVFRVALDTCRSTAPAASGADAPVAFDQRNLLCLPLSIVIDFASRSGLHDRVAQEWNRVKRAGFAFDPHNWNHLCAALARADRLGDALQVIEHVLPHVPPA